MTQYSNTRKEKAGGFKRQVAKLNHLHIAPRKVRMVADLVKGLSVNEAEAQLFFQRSRPAKPLLKLLRSAVANAVHNAHCNPEKLYIENLRVDQGPMLKRTLPRARGVATPIQKKMSHITLVISENPDLKPPRFKIVVPKKTKKKTEEIKKDRKTGEKKPMEKSPSSKPGFLKRIFRRKSV